MAITGRDFDLEEKRLTEVLKLLDDKLAQMGEDIFEDEDKFMEFRRYTWDNMRAMDAQELNQATVESEFEANKIFINDWINGPKGELNKYIANDCDGIISGLYEYDVCYQK